MSDYPRMRDEYPTCPKCETEIEEWWCVGNDDAHDGDELEFTCDECGHEFKVRVNIDVSFDEVKDETPERKG
jgi:DNA-directed RNA polymerase subunit M/transcription elongation factor TFIIS